MLTARQLEVLRYIAEVKRDPRRPTPTMREMCTHFGWGSTKSVADHLDALQRKGMVGRHPRSARSVFLTDEGLAELGRAA